MKIVTKLAMIPTLGLLCCSMAQAQDSYSNSLVGATLIYSNAFDGAAVNISNTPPDYAVTLFGGSNNAVWLDALGSADTNAFYANGAVGTPQGDSILLPFTPQSNLVYTFTATVTFSGNPGNWIGAGFAQNYVMGTKSGARYADSGVNGYDFSILTEGSGNVQSFAGPHASGGFFNKNGFFPAGPGTHTLTQILDTTSNKWVIATFVDGLQAGANDSPYSSNPTLHALGITQNSLTPGNQGNVHWDSVTLSAAQLLVVKEPDSAAVSAGASFTNTVQVAGTPPFYYQWYENGAAIAGATNASLALNSATPGDAGDYNIVVTNGFGAVTSVVASVIVYTMPSVSSFSPFSYTNPITLYGGTNSDGTNFAGSSPTFSVSVNGGVPLAYQWFTNNVAVGGATNISFTFTNCQLDSPTNFSVIVTNIYGSTTSQMSVAYLPAPTAPYPQGVLAGQPAAFWRLNEQPNNGPGNNGTIGNDYESGNNGIYTNVVLDQQGNDSTEPTETSVGFGTGGIDNSYLGSINSLDFAKPTGSNGEFTVDAWANCGAVDTGAPIISQGTYGVSDAFNLGADSSRHYQFYVRTANGTVYTADSTMEMDDGYWHFVAGVCDEANSNLSLYIDGQQVAKAYIPTNSGVYEADAPMAIGAGTQNAASGYNVQFFGNIDDVAAYKYPLSAGQIAQVFGPVPITFFAPLPPTNAVFEANETLSISATAFGDPPIGYYWTNLTTGLVMGSGTTNVLRDLNASLIISNAPASLSGDQLELVVTNANSSTNWMTTLFSPPPPETISYTNSILYSNDFNGGTWPLAGMPASFANSLVGGTNTVWTDALGTNDTGIMQASGVDASTLGDSWVLPFTPEPGYVYTLTASVTFSGNPGNWIGLGFAERVPTNAAVGYGRFSDGGDVWPDMGPYGYDWEILTEGSGNVQDFGGPGGQGQLISQNGFFTAGAGTHTAEVVLDTTGSQWVMADYVDGTQAGTNYPYSANPPIGAIGITQNSLTSPGNVQWNYFSLSEVAPGGVPPYLLAPLPPSSVLLTNSTVTIPATAYGSAPLGYTWSYNSTVIESGVTNNLSPINADLSVPSASLSAGQLQLTVTNAYGTNITLVTLISPINPNPTNIVSTVTNNTLYLTWPADHTGWQLQAQTNSVSVGIGTNWVDVAGSTTTNQIAVPINPANGVVFYRLIYTP